MKKIAFFVCFIFTIVNIYGNEPLKPKEKGKSNKNDTNLSASKMAMEADFIYPVWGFYVNAAPGMSQISNDNLSDVWTVKNGFGYSFSAGYFKSFSPYFKIIAGVGISSVTTKLEGSGIAYDDEILKDIDTDDYIETLKLNNAVETTNPMYLSVPILLEIGNPNIDKIGFYVDLGVRISYLLNANSFVTKTGTYETYGTYPIYGNLKIENVPELGFYGEKRGREVGLPYAKFEDNAKLNSLNFSIQGGVGISIPISSNIIFKGGVVTNWGLQDIAKPGASDDPNVKPETREARHKFIDNSFAANKGSFTRHFGVEFGIYINRLLK